LRALGREHAVDVGVDLAVAVQRRRQRHRRRVRAAAAESGHVVGRRHALEACHEHDLAPLERLGDAPRPDLDDLGLRVHRVGDDPGLGARQRDGVVAQIVDRHRAQRGGDALAGREQHVHLARVRPGRDLLGQLHQLVGRVAHGGDDADDPAPGQVGGDEPGGDAADLVRVGHGRAAELHHEDSAGSGLRFRLGHHAMVSRMAAMSCRVVRGLTIAIRVTTSPATVVGVMNAAPSRRSRALHPV
jgi:hypothetical protein